MQTWETLSSPDIEVFGKQLISHPSEKKLTYGAVNNLGYGYSIPADFVDVGRQEYVDIVAVNVTANVCVTHIILPMMIKKRQVWEELWTNYRSCESNKTE